MPKSLWSGKDDRAVVGEMLADKHSPYWVECDRYVKRYIFKKFSSLPEYLQAESVQETMLSNS